MTWRDALGCAIAGLVTWLYWWETRGRHEAQRRRDREEMKRIRAWRRRGRPLG